MAIKGEMTLAEIKRMVRTADRTAYIKLPKEKRTKHLAAYKQCSNEEGEMPKGVAFDLIKFSALFQLIEDSLDVENKERAEEFTIAITRILTLQPVRLGDVVFGLVRVQPNMVVFNPQHPSLGPVGGVDAAGGEDEEAYDE